MNIGIINTFSNTKSTGKIAFGLYKHLSKNNNVYLFYGEPKEEPVLDKHVILINNRFDKKMHMRLSQIFGDQGYYSKIATKKLVKRLEAENIECLYLLNIHGYYLNLKILFDFIAKKSIKVIYVMLDEYAFLGKCCFSYDCERYKKECGKCPLINDYPKSLFFDKSRKILLLKKKLYDKVNDLTFVSIPYIVEKARESMLLKNRRIVSLEEGIDLKGIYYPREVDKLKKKHNIKNDKIVLLLVAPFSNHRKGGKYFLELAKRFENDDNYVFINVGYNGPLESCPTNFIPVNYLENQSELAEYYSLADFFVCTSLAETVADTCLESLACGTPIIGFSNSGLPYSIKEKHCIFVDSMDVDALYDTIKKVSKKRDSVSKSCREYAVAHFDFDSYLIQLEKLINS